MEVFIQQNYSIARSEIFVREQRGSQEVYLHFDGSNMVEQVISDPGTAQDIKPFISCPVNMWEELVNAFIKEGARRNIRTENENHLKGKLEATELHLKDMRDMSVKLIDKIIKP